ncbi:MAG: hypothetical protein LE178_05465, partial [Endomicrobium sp.]|nr:hypothetical protein [Endomicrobium sp.]
MFCIDIGIKLISHREEVKIKMIHQTSIIDKTVVIGANVEIGAYTVIGRDVVIGEGTVIGSNVFIEFAEIGKNCKIYNSASIGTSPQDFGYVGEYSMVYIGDGTTVREFVTLNRGTKKTGKTVIGKNCHKITVFADYSFACVF